MATISFSKDLDAIRDQVRSYLASTGETITSLASRSEVPRDFLYRFINESYKSSPSFEYVCRIIHACGKKLVIENEENFPHS